MSGKRDTRFVVLYLLGLVLYALFLIGACYLFSTIARVLNLVTL